MSLNRFSGGTETSNDTPNNPIMWPHNWVQTTSCGHFLEMNNTANGQRVRLVHGITKNYIDMDVKKNTQIKSHQDFIVRSDRNTVFEVGRNPDSDMMSLTVRGDLRIYVEGDTHYECEGDFSHRVNGNYKLTVGGNYLTETKSNYSLKTGGTTKIKTAEFINKGTTYESHYKTAEYTTDKFHTVTQTSSTGAITTRSEGNMVFDTKGTKYDQVEKNVYDTIRGKIVMNVFGNTAEDLQGGNFIDSVDTPQSQSYYINVHSGDMQTYAAGNINVIAGGNIDMDATAIYLN